MRQPYSPPLREGLGVGLLGVGLILWEEHLNIVRPPS